jgi:hypothetical protein
MTTALEFLIKRIESDTLQYYSCEEVLELLKDYELIQEENIKTAFLHGKINARQYPAGSEFNLGSDEYFINEWNN